MNRSVRAAASFFVSAWCVVALAAVHGGCGGSEISGDDTGRKDASPKETSTDTTVRDAGDASHDGKSGRDGGSDADARDGTRDGSTEAAPDATVDGAGDATLDVLFDVTIEGGGPALVALAVGAVSDSGTIVLPLVPTFSPDTFDYYVRCATDNTLAVSMTASSGAESALEAPTKSASKPSQVVTLSVLQNQAIVAAATEGARETDYWVRCLPPDFPDIEWAPHPEAGTPSPGYYLVGNFSAGGPSGGYAVVLNGDGVPVWYYKNAGGGITNVDEMVDGSISYLQVGGQPIELVQIDPLVSKATMPAGGVPIDFHELRILSNGHYLIISSPIEAHKDLSKLPPDAGCAPDTDANVVACDIVELDPDSGAEIWTWRATDHFDPGAVSIHPILGGGRGDGGVATTGCDTFHCNAIDVDPANGNLLVSGREMDSVFYIDRATGTVLWKMGGAKATLDNATYIPVASPFVGQHDPRLQPGWSTCAGGQISLFDDETWPGTGNARGAVYDVKLGLVDGGCDGGEAGVAGASLAWEYAGTGSSFAEGSHRVEPDGSHVIGWGLHGGIVFTEVSASGLDLLDLNSTGAGGGFPMESYRAIKVPTSALDLNAMRATAGGP